MITVPTVAQLRDQIITDIEGKIGQTIPAMPKAFFRVLATALAGVLSLVYRFGVWIYDQIFPQTADAEALVRIGEQYGIVRTPAVAAVINATAAGTNGTTIPAGTLWQTGGIVYQQEDAETISGGVATVTLEALVQGDSTNLANGSTISLVTPIAGVTADATVASTTTSGEDQETLETYRSRIIFRLRQRPQGGAAADYVNWALEVPGIVKAFAYRTAPGDVTVYPLVALTGSRLPNAGKLAEVLAYLDDTRRRPLCADIATAAMTERVFTMTVTTLQTDSSSIRAAISAAWQSYMDSRFPRQYTDESNPTDYVTKSGLFAEAVGAGVTILDFNLYRDGSLVISHQLAVNELARLGTITWPS